MLYGTPVFDIKPYIPLTDMRTDASEGFTGKTKSHRLEVIFDDGLEESMPDKTAEAVKGILQNDPRPGYADDPERIYGLEYSGYEIRFRSDGKCVYVITVQKIKNDKTALD